MSGIKIIIFKQQFHAIMYEELFGTTIEQIVIIMASEDGAGQVFIKNKADYLSHLEEAIKHFYKYYEEEK